MTYLFRILTKWLFRFTSPSIYCYQKIAAPSYVGGLFFCLDIQVIRQKGYILGNVFAGRPMSSNIILTWLIDISDAFHVFELNGRSFLPWCLWLRGLSYLKIFGWEGHLFWEEIVVNLLTYMPLKWKIVMFHQISDPILFFENQTVVTSSHCSPYGTSIYLRILQAAAGMTNPIPHDTNAGEAGNAVLSVVEYSKFLECFDYLPNARMGMNQCDECPSQVSHLGLI